MGILNVTPDSFACHCESLEREDILAAYERLVAEGADMVDVGACSTKPGGQIVDEEEEKRRLQAALSAIRSVHPKAPLSVDTFRASVAQWAVAQYGVQLINDVSGLSDPDMATVVANARVPYVLTCPRDVKNMSEMVAFFAFQLDVLHRAGVSDVIIDPGFGFGKSHEVNYYILNHLRQLKVLDTPVLVGVSRKSMIYKELNCTSNEALNGTTVVHTLALLQGADILRVHDVRAAKQAIQIVQTYQKMNEL
ncbi:MAG: dihydropteroate synthase [Paludibacteraceae bacterium]|nr:dihydropteroate synthase [Paludibacteraceae bacterium]